MPRAVRTLKRAKRKALAIAEKPMTAPARGRPERRDIGKGGVDAESGAAIVLRDALDGLDADGGKDQREAEAAEGRAGQGHPGRIGAPEQEQPQGFDREAGHGHRESAKAVDGLDEEQPRHDEGRAKGGQAEGGAVQWRLA